jgi:hypothetical protein
MSVKYKKFLELKSKIAKSLKDTLIKESTLPKEERQVDFEVIVPFQQLDLDNEDDDYAKALVIYSVMYPREKKHVVHVKFQYSPAGKFLRETMLYV